MNVNVLKSLWEEINANRTGKVVKLIDYNKYINNHPEKNIKDISYVQNCYTIYDMYSNEHNDNVKKCMDKLLRDYKNSKDIAYMFRKLVKLSDNSIVLHEIYDGKMSINQFYHAKVNDLILYGYDNKNVVNPNHLKDDSEPVITGETLLSCLWDNVNMLVSNIEDTVSQAQMYNVNKSVAYKDVCAEMLSNISNSIKTLEATIS